MVWNVDTSYDSMIMNDISGGGDGSGATITTTNIIGSNGASATITTTDNNRAMRGCD